jgi:hypothetical protein
LFCTEVSSPSITVARNNAFLWSETDACIISEIQSAFSFLWFHSEFKYSFISLYNVNEAKVQEMWPGTVHACVSKRTMQRRDSIRWWWGR